MEPTVVELRERYRAMSTDELVELRVSDQLTDMARPIVDEELRARGIEPTAVATQRPVPTRPMSTGVPANFGAALSEASNPIQIFRIYWAGKGRLSGAFWGYGFAGTLSICAFSIIFGLLLLPVALRGHQSVLESGVFRTYVLVISLALIAYHIVVWILIWRNAANVENQIWGLVAKLAVIASASLAVARIFSSL